jgi:hypothetical protein
MDNNSEKIKEASASSFARDAALGRALVQSIPAGGGDCPLPEEMALLIDGALTGERRDLLLGHLASCTRCREIFLTARELAQEEVPRRSRRLGWGLSGLAASAALCLIAVRLTPGIPAPAHTELAQRREFAAPRAAQAPDQPLRVASSAPAPAKRTGTSRHQAAAARRPVGEALDLLSPEEAARPAAKAYGFASQERSEGPIISVVSPIEDAEEGPISALRVKFTPRAGDRVDLTSIKLECLKETPLDLTPRIRPYLTRDGINAEKVRLPEGIYRFRVGIADYQGRFSEKEFTVKVSGTF